MSHANAALTPVHRARIGRLVVEEGWSVAEAARFFRVSYPTAAKWARRFAEMGRAGMEDRSSRPHRSPTKTAQPLVRKIVHVRIKKRVGPVEIASRTGIPASTVYAVLKRCRLRLSHVDVRTGEVIRRYEHDYPGSMIHVDVKKLGNIPDGGGHRFVGTQQAARTNARQKECAAALHDTRSMATPTFTPSSMTTPVSPTPRSTTTRPQQQRSVSSSERLTGSPPTASTSTPCYRTTAAATVPTPGVTPAATSGSNTAAPAPTGPKRTARSNASTAPWPTAGPTPSTTTPKKPAEQPYPPGSTSTINIGNTPPSARSHQSPD